MLIDGQAPRHGKSWHNGPCFGQANMYSVPHMLGSFSKRAATIPFTDLGGIVALRKLCRHNLGWAEQRKACQYTLAGRRQTLKGCRQRVKRLIFVSTSETCPAIGKFAIPDNFSDLEATKISSRGPWRLLCLFFACFINREQLNTTIFKSKAKHFRTLRDLTEDLCGLVLNWGWIFTVAPS